MEVEPVELVQMNIYHSNTFRNLNWLHFDNEPSVPEKQKVKDQQTFIISVFVAYLTIPNNN